MQANVFFFLHLTVPLRKGTDTVYSELQNSPPGEFNIFKATLMTIFIFIFYASFHALVFLLRTQDEQVMIGLSGGSSLPQARQSSRLFGGRGRDRSAR